MTHSIGICFSRMSCLLNGKILLASDFEEDYYRENTTSTFDSSLCIEWLLYPQNLETYTEKCLADRPLSLYIYIFILSYSRILIGSCL